MKDRIVWLMIMVIGLAGVAGAKTILVCSDCQVPGVGGGDHEDDTLVAWLITLGYTVDTYGMNEVYRESNEGPPVAPSTFYDRCVAADLIFMSRRTSSGQINDAGSPKAWNELPTPFLLNGNIAMIRGINNEDRLGWATSDDSSNDDDNYWRKWDGVKDVEDLVMFDWTGSPVGGGTPRAPKSVGRFEDWPEDPYEGPVGITDNLGTGYDLAGGTRIMATYQDNDKGVWVVFPAGTDFDAGQIPPNGPTTDRYGTSTAARVFYGHWGYDTTDGGPGGTPSSWDQYLTDLYKDTLAEVMDELTGGDPNLNPPPTCDAGPDQVLYEGEFPLKLSGSSDDEGPENPAAPGWPGGILSIGWSKLTGPGTVTFDPADGTDDNEPNVTAISLPGDYELLMTVYDSTGQEANDIVLVRVKTHAGEALVGHWDFEGDADDQSTNSNNGVFAQEEGGYPKYDPNSAIGSFSISLADPLPAVDPIDPNIANPNIPHIDLGPAPELDFSDTDWTIAAWFKTTQQRPGTADVGKAAIFANGADSGGGHRYCLINNEGRLGRTDVVTDDNSEKNTADTVNAQNLSDGNWHFVVGLREDDELRIYRDGVLDDTEGISNFTYDLSGTSAWNSHIGAIVKANEPNNFMYKQFQGLIDDVKVYNYALDEAEILGLTSAGPIVAVVEVPDDFEINWKPSSPPTEVIGVITDNGAPDLKTIGWTSIGPGEDEASFDLSSTASTLVTFPAAGVYTLTLSVWDPDAPQGEPDYGYITDDVVVTVNVPTCADVIADGLVLAYDVAGGDEAVPGGGPDCYVGLEDLVFLFMGDPGYLNCNDPLDANCPWPF